MSLNNIVFFVGDENLIGPLALPSDAPADLQTVAPGVMWLRGAWRRMQPGQRQMLNGFGPEVSFSYACSQESPNPPAIVKILAPEDAPDKVWTVRRFKGIPSRAISVVAEATKKQAGSVRGLVLARRLNASPPDHVVIQRIRQGLNQPSLPVVIVRKGGGSQADDPPLSSVVPHDPDMIALGNAIASAIPAYEGPRQQWIWRSRSYECWYEGPEKPTSVFVAFPDFQRGDGFSRYGFGQNWFSSRNAPCIYIRCAQSLWFQDQEILEVIKAIRAFAGTAQLTTYGLSMGGFGALLFSGALQAENVIAIAPQFSIDRAIAPFETRWHGVADHIGHGGTVHDMHSMVSGTARKILIYDERSADGPQVALFRKDSTWRTLRLPFGGHEAAQMLREANALSSVLDTATSTGPDLAAIAQTRRKGRRNSVIYWLNMAHQASQSRPNVALYALSQLERLNSHPRLVRRMRANLEEATSA
ncbi:MAG: hypothetical protein ACPGGK_13155 [Pikeienuella sp.]